MAVKSWIEGDETASEILSRVSRERPFLLLPPLHRLPLRVGNVVELVGPSPSAKTLILIQAIVTCVIPKEWNGIKYGGLGRFVMFIDLDCRFDMLCLSNVLRQRIMEANGLTSEKNVSYVEELHELCLRRFLYTRCYDSFEFLATLKTLHRQLDMVKEAENNSVYLLMIDSIGAFHWVDRASTITPSANINRKSLSLQSVSETVVQEMKKVLLVHPMLIIATKAISLGDNFSSNDAQWKKSFQAFPESKKGTISSQKLPYREFMPAVWQRSLKETLCSRIEVIFQVSPSFVTHKILVRSSDDHLNEKQNQNCPVYLAEWLLPPLSVVDRFVVKQGFVHVV